MKNKFINSALLFSATAFAQEIPQSKVPSEVVNSFQTSFPDASHFEWKQDGDNYKVEFEHGVFMLSNDHDVLFDKTGKIIKHKEEITTSDLPKILLTKIKTDFSEYKIDGTKRITENARISYEVELKKHKSDLKVTFDENGNVLRQKED